MQIMQSNLENSGQMPIESSETLIDKIVSDYEKSELLENIEQYKGIDFTAMTPHLATHYDGVIVLFDEQLANSCRQMPLLITKDDAETWLSENKDIWHHPLIADRTQEKVYELADLLKDFANFILQNKAI